MGVMLCEELEGHGGKKHANLWCDDRGQECVIRILEALGSQ